MSILFSRGLGDSPSQLIPSRGRGAVGSVRVDNDSAMMHSAVWACIRLRADLLSTMPLISYRQIGTIQAEVPLTPFLQNPAGDRFGALSWLYASQVDLERMGNTFGVIKAFDSLGKPAVVELAAAEQVKVKGRGSTITGYKIGRKDYAPSEVWHERQFDLPGSPVGLSPIAYAAMTIGTALSAQKFGADWFRNGTIPSGALRNKAKTVKPDEAEIAKQRFREAVADRDLFVHGVDWEFSPYEISANESQFLETLDWTTTDVARFWGVPGDLIDAPSKGSSITYANITQRNLQVLIMNLGPTVRRREVALSDCLPRPRFVRFDTDHLLRMDPETREKVIGQQVKDRTLAPSEARALDNRPPFTEEQLAEFDRLFGGRAPAPSTPAAGGTP